MICKGGIRPLYCVHSTTTTNKRCLIVLVKYDWCRQISNAIMIQIEITEILHNTIFLCSPTHYFVTVNLGMSSRWSVLVSSYFGEIFSRHLLLNIIKYHCRILLSWSISRNFMIYFSVLVMGCKCRFVERAFLLSWNLCMLRQLE